MEKVKLSHSDLITFAWYHILPNEMKTPWYIATFESNMANTKEVPDIIGFGENDIDDCVVIECKASRSDFLKDQKKAFRVYPDKGMGRKRIYVVADGVVESPSEIPDGWMCYLVPNDHTFVMYKHPINDGYATSDKYIFSDICRNWHDEYVTYRYIKYWQEKKGREPKVPNEQYSDITDVYNFKEWENENSSYKDRTRRERRKAMSLL